MYHTLYLKTCYYTEDKETPAFLTFFEDQAEVKREHAKQFIRYLKKYKCKVCLPVIKRLDIENWGTGKKAIESALQLENTLSSLLQDLKALASRKKQASLARFMKKFLDEQIRNISYLEYQLGYQEELEKMAKNEGQDEKAAVASEASGAELSLIKRNITNAIFWEGNIQTLKTLQDPAC
ncbi:ferritin, heavy polypeptide 1b [Camelus ferus]|nr:ferritin, heavy polypeptide 1b [Camelus ferus]